MTQSYRNHHARRGAVAVFVALALTLIMAFTALSVDMGVLYAAKAELQRTADSAALAAAAELAVGGGEAAAQAAHLAADETARRNPVLSAEVGVSATTDLEMGQAVPSGAGGGLVFSPSGPPYSAVRVTIRRTESSAAGAISLSFARALGHDHVNLEARAAAVLVPRDIAVVIDLSNSMNHDSQLRYWNRNDGGNANTRDVWAALDGPEPSRPYMPGPETATEYAGDMGPTFGNMDEWGTPLTPGSYDSSSDPGLIHIARYVGTNGSGINADLAARGYSAAEISALKSKAKDGSQSHWKNRSCVILGLAEWRSGKPGGKYASGGDGDNKVENSELTAWVPFPAWASGGSWKHYILWAGYNWNYKYTIGEFRYRYGPKTFTDYLLERYPENYNTNNLWATPQQPLRATKDAVQTMIDEISALDSLDRVSLEIFASTSQHEVNLTDSLQDISDTLYARQSGHYDRATNISGGLAEAISELNSSRARPNAHKVIMLMSDGSANTDQQGNWLGDGSSAAKQYALDMAQEAADQGFVIHTISVGYSVDRDLMQQVAEIGNGVEFFAAGNPEEYSEDLKQIFQSLGGKRPVAIIE